MADDDLEFEAKLDRLAGVFAEYLGGSREQNLDAAEYVLMRTWLPGAGYGVVTKPTAQRRALADLLKNARKLALSYSDLEEPVRTAIGFELPDKVETARYRSADRLSLGVILALPELIQRALPAGYAAIEDAKPAGRTKWIAVGIVADCRHLWELRLGASAPHTVSVGSRFDEFLTCVFEAADVKANPRAAIDAWSGLRIEEDFPSEL